MSASGLPPASTTADRAALPPSDSDPRLRRFLRCGHILGSLLRELLEEFDPGEPRPGSLTRTQFCLLKLCTVSPELPLSEVARHLGVTPAAMTKNVDKLERLGLVSRSVRETDRRSIVLTASPAGVDLVRSYESFKESRIAPVMAGLDPQEIDTLCDRLELLCVDLVRRGAGAGRCCMRCAGYSDANCPVGRELGDCALHSRSAPAVGLPEGRVHDRPAATPASSWRDET